MMEGRNSQISIQQKHILLEFMRKNEHLQAGKFSPAFTVKQSQKLWQELTDLLNSSPGAKKDWKKWRKVCI